MTYDDAVAKLYQAESDQFVAERKRLANELKAGGDKSGAAKLAKLARPTLSAWAVNQLWWHARDSFEQLFSSAERLRAGEHEAARAHRELIASLRARAAARLSEAGHAVSDPVLRRVTATLSALAAHGSFEPDAPGALAVDRDAPGFEVAGLAAALSAGSPKPSARGPVDVARAVAEPESAVQRQRIEQGQEQEQERVEAADRLRIEQEQRQAKAAAERLRIEEEQKRREAEGAARAERARLEDAVRAARIQIETRKLELERARTALAAAEQRLEQARAAASEFETRLARREPC
jgi:hypothetical protein